MTEVATAALVAGVIIWCVAWSFAGQFERFLVDALLWTGVIALVGAVSVMATDMVSKLAMTVAVICAVSVSGWQGRAHYLSSEDR